MLREIFTSMLLALQIVAIEVNSSSKCSRNNRISRNVHISPFGERIFPFKYSLKVPTLFPNPFLRYVIFTMCMHIASFVLFKFPPQCYKWSSVVVVVIVIVEALVACKYCLSDHLPYDFLNFPN